METVIVEEINGEIIITNLVSKSFPIIRYRLGDKIIFDNVSFCPCGRESFIIKEVSGRVGKKIYGFKQEYPNWTTNYIFRNLAINKKITLNYQIEQREKGKIILNIEQGLENKQREIFLQEVRKYYGGDVEVEIRTGIETFAQPAVGKERIWG